METTTDVAPSEVTGATFGDTAARLTAERLPGLDDRAVALGLALIRTSTVHMQQSERRVHRPQGWSWSGFHIMYMVWLFGEIEARDIARLAAVSRQTASTVLANLEKKGFVHRERTSATDKRVITITLTAQGRQAIDEAFAAQNALETQWFGVLTSQERDQLKGLLDKVAARITQTPRPGIG